MAALKKNKAIRQFVVEIGNSDEDDADEQFFDEPEHLAAHFTSMYDTTDSESKQLSPTAMTMDNSDQPTSSLAAQLCDSTTAHEFKGLINTQKRYKQDFSLAKWLT